MLLIILLHPALHLNQSLTALNPLDSTEGAGGGAVLPPSGSRLSHYLGAELCASATPSAPPLFRTLTGDDWKRGLALARTENARFPAQLRTALKNSTAARARAPIPLQRSSEAEHVAHTHDVEGSIPSAAPLFPAP